MQGGRVEGRPDHVDNETRQHKTCMISHGTRTHTRFKWSQGEAQKPKKNTHYVLKAHETGDIIIFKIICSAVDSMYIITMLAL